MTPEKGLIDLKKAGVIDPARVTREAVQNAVSIAATTITMGALIVELPNKDEAAAADQVAVGGALLPGCQQRRAHVGELTQRQHGLAETPDRAQRGVRVAELTADIVADLPHVGPG